MASKWFPGIKDAAYWREIKNREYAKKSARSRAGRIRKRPEPTESYSDMSLTGAEIRISRAGSKDPWYLEINDNGSTSISELHRMSKASAREHLENVKQYYMPPNPPDKIKYDVDTLSLDGAVEALQEIKSRSKGVISIEIERIELAIVRAKEIIASA